MTQVVGHRLTRCLVQCDPVGVATVTVWPTRKTADGTLGRGQPETLYVHAVST
jgi:hypothetical protein